MAIKLLKPKLAYSKSTGMNQKNSVRRNIGLALLFATLIFGGGLLLAGALGSLAGVGVIAACGLTLYSAAAATGYFASKINSTVSEEGSENDPRVQVKLQHAKDKLKGAEAIGEDVNVNYFKSSSIKSAIGGALAGLLLLALIAAFTMGGAFAGMGILPIILTVAGTAAITGAASMAVTTASPAIARISYSDKLETLMREEAKSEGKDSSGSSREKSKSTAISKDGFSKDGYKVEFELVTRNKKVGGHGEGKNNFLLDSSGNPVLEHRLITKYLQLGKDKDGKETISVVDQTESPLSTSSGSASKLRYDMLKRAGVAERSEVIAASRG